MALRDALTSLLLELLRSDPALVRKLYSFDELSKILGKGPRDEESYAAIATQSAQDITPVRRCLLASQRWSDAKVAGRFRLAMPTKVIICMALYLSGTTETSSLRDAIVYVMDFLR